MRPDIDIWGLQLAKVVSARSTCMRLQVGCVLLNKRGHIIATGYNGVASGQPHCNKQTCADLETCQALHAEWNALLQCRNVYEIDTCYITNAPCFNCTKLLLNTSCQRIIFHEGPLQPKSQNIWSLAGREWILC